MKVLYLDQSGQLGGGEIALLPWLCVQRDHALVVLFEDGPFRERLQQERVPVQVVPMEGLKAVRRGAGWRSGLVALPALLRTRADVRRLARDADVLYANSMKALIVAALVRRWRQPIVWHLRDILSADHFSSPLRRLVVAIANRCASSIIANSEATADAFVSAGGRRTKVTVIYDGVSAAKFEQSDAVSICSLREQLAPRERLLLGVFSRLSPWKGQHIVLDAIGAIPGVDLLVVGDALFGEAAYADALHTRAVQPDLSGRVTFLGFRHDVADLMRSVDIVVHSSTSAEPFGLVIVEGMLAGKPVIATDAGGATEIIQSGNTGILVAPGSVAALHEAILQLSSDHGFALRLGHAGRAHATRTFPLQAMFAGIDRVLRRFDERGRQMPGAIPSHSSAARVEGADTGIGNQAIRQ